jgi:hypothetical protein
MSKSKRNFEEVEENLRNQLGIWDASFIGDITDNVMPWVGVCDGREVIFRNPPFMFAYTIHNMGRYFAEFKMDFSKPGKHEVQVVFDVYCYHDPSTRIDGVTMTIPYEIKVEFKPQEQKVTSKKIADLIKKIQEG